MDYQIPQKHLYLVLSGFVAAACWPLANFLNVNFDQVALGLYNPIHSIFVFTLVILGTGLLLAWLADRIIPNSQARVLSILAAVTFLVFSSGAIRGLTVWVFAVLDVNTGGITLTLLALALLTLATVFISKYAPFRTAISVGALVAFLLPFSGLVLASVSWKFHPSVDEPTLVDVTSSQGKGQSNMPNVYYIIVDGYAGSQGLKALGGDNTAFLDIMRSRGFHVDERAKSNYLMTYLSLMAILSADYIVQDASAHYANRARFFPSALNGKTAPNVLQRFTRIGYKTIRIANWWAGCPDKSFEICYQDNSSSGGYVLNAFLSGNTVGSLMLRQFELNVGDYAGVGALEVLLDKLPDIVAAEPFFLFVHNLAPHTPFTRSADCAPRKYSKADGALPTAQQKQLYLAAMSCINLQLTTAVDDILLRDPQALVVIQSDHGSEFNVDWDVPLDKWSNEALAERISILNLTRLPKSCSGWNRQGLGQINTMRMVLACVTGTPPEYLPEFTYISAYEGHPSYGSVFRINN